MSLKLEALNRSLERPMKLQRRSRAKIFSLALAASAAVAAIGLGPTPASAQGFSFWELFSAPRREPARDWRRHAEPQHPTARKKSRGEGAESAGAKSPLEAKPEAAALERPLFMVASIADQHVSVYNHRGLVARSAISTGIAGHPTPKGIFTIIGRERYHRSNIYSGAPMPFMQRVTWSGIAMHLGVVPGHPASHGCIRLPAAFAAKLWGMTRIGERVVISPHDVNPVEFEHPLLPTPKMRASAESEKTDPAAAERNSILPQQQAKAESGGEASNAAKAAPAADSIPMSDIAADEPAGDPKEQASKAGAGDEASNANKAVSDDDPLRTATADASAVTPREQVEQPKAETSVEAAGIAKAAPAAEPRQSSVPDIDRASAKPETEQPKVDAAGGKVDTAVIDSKTVAPNRPSVNPLEYAQQLRAKAAAEAAATSKAFKALSAEVGMKQKEAARTATDLRAAEAAQTLAWRKAYTADASYEAAAAAAARQRESAEAAEREAPAGAGQAKAKADRLTRAYGKALLAEDAALLAKTNAQSAFAEATARLKEARIAFAPKNAELTDAEQRLDEARAASALAATAQREAERRMMPISILISKKERRIYVRQGLSPLFDAPIEIRDPDTPLGSHLFIATAPKEDGSSLKWSVISMPVRFGDEPSERRKTASAETGASWNLRNSGASATEALERVNISKDVRDKLAERLWTGASLIISDQPVSGETGNDGTDLTIKIH